MYQLLNHLQDLKKWFEVHQRILPWRNKPTVYRVWVSEIMLQQTQVITVLAYFKKFIQRFPTVEILAKSSLSEVYYYWSGLGYYSRAKRLHQAAQEINAQGRFPKTLQEWLQVPGIGPYTAGAIVSIALNQPEPILDANVERVLSRIGGIQRERGEASYKKSLWNFSSECVKKAFKLHIQPRIINQALMELGALVCTSKNPKCSLCPVHSICFAFQTSSQKDFPNKKESKRWLEVQEEAFCLIDNKKRFLLHQDSSRKWRKGLWDFPQKPLPLLLKQAEYLGEILIHYRVTRHKVERKTKIWKLNPTLFITAAEALGGEYQWVDPLKAKVAIGSPLRKILEKINKNFFSLL